MFIGLFGIFGLLSGSKLVAGALGAAWGFSAAIGAYELNRRKFDWARGRKNRDRNLLVGTVAVSAGLMMSGAMHETMPFLALLPGLSAVIQANDGRQSKIPMLVHGAILGVGLGIGIWFYIDGVIGGVLLANIEAMP